MVGSDEDEEESVKKVKTEEVKEGATVKEEPMDTEENTPVLTRSKVATKASKKIKIEPRELHEVRLKLVLKCSYMSRNKSF